MAEMTGMLGGNDLMMLSGMLDETKLSEETVKKDRVKQLGPGDIGPPKKVPPLHTTLLHAWRASRMLKRLWSSAV